MEGSCVGCLVVALLCISQTCHAAPAQSKVISNCNLFNDVSEVNLKASENLMPEPWQIYKNDGMIKHGQLCPLGDSEVIDFDPTSGKYTLYTYSKVFSFAPVSTGAWPLKEHSIISLGDHRIMAIDYGSGNYLMSDCSSSKGKLKISCSLTSEGTLSSGSVALYVQNDMMLIMNSRTGKYRVAHIKDMTSFMAKGNLAASAPGTWLSVGQSRAVPGEDLVINVDGNSFKLYAFSLTHTEGKGQPLLLIAEGKMTPHDAYVGLPDGKFMAYNKTGSYAIWQCSAGQMHFHNPAFKYGNTCEELTRGSLNSDPRDPSTWAKMSTTSRTGKILMAEPSQKLPDLSAHDAIPVQKASEHRNLVNLLQNADKQQVASVQPASHPAVTTITDSSDGFSTPSKVVMVESHADKLSAASHHLPAAKDLAVHDTFSTEFKKDEVDLLKSKLQQTRSELGSTEDEVDRLRKRVTDVEAKNVELEHVATTDESDEKSLKAKLRDTESKLKAQVEANEKAVADFRAREAEDKKIMEAEFATKLQKFREELAHEFDHERNSISKLLATKNQPEQTKDSLPAPVPTLPSLPLGAAPVEATLVTPPPAATVVATKATPVTDTKTPPSSDW